MDMQAFQKCLAIEEAHDISNNLQNLTHLKFVVQDERCIVYRQCHL